MLTESCRKVAKKNCCKECNYTTSRKSSYDKHLLTSKHIMLTNVNNEVAKSCEVLINDYNFTCEYCNKQYNSRVGLWKHKKKCNKMDILTISETNEPNNDDDITDKELIIMLLKENKALQTMIIDQNSAVLELCKNGTHNTSNNNNNNTNSHNKTFNLQFFLNETCKNAMNISDFVQSIQVQLSDLEKLGEIGYIDGISNIIVKNLHDLDITERPIHCTDKKREVLYIKDENKWEKEDEENNKLRKAIKHVAYKNTKMLSAFREKYPDCGKSESKYSDKYNKLVIEAMGGKGDNDKEKENKIIKNIAREVLVDK
jgi:hypothetical protein